MSGSSSFRYDCRLPFNRPSSSDTRKPTIPPSIVRQQNDKDNEVYNAKEVRCHIDVQVYSDYHSSQIETYS